MSERVSVARDSLLRLSAEAASLGFAFLAAVATARLLGPAGKGNLSTLVFLVGLFSQISLLGLGDASVILVGQRRVDLRTALSSSLAATLAASAAGALLLFAACRSLFRLESPEILDAVLVSCLALPISSVSTIATQILNARGQFTLTSLLLVGSAASTAAGILLLVGVLGLGIVGAVTATLLASVLSLLITTATLVVGRVPPVPRWNFEFMRLAIPYGLRLQASGLAIALTSRADVLIVFALAGQVAAGLYSVALTIGGLVALVPVALAYTIFPRLASAEPEAASALAAKAFRFSLMASVLVAVGLMLVIPLAMSQVFGDPFAPAVVPALVLVVAYVLGGSQWILGRAAAARGHPMLLLLSYIANLATMTITDVALVPILGILGASVGALFGCLVGLAVCLRPELFGGAHGLQVSDLRPKASDARELLQASVALLRELSPTK